MDGTRLSEKKLEKFDEGWRVIDGWDEGPRMVYKMVEYRMEDQGWDGDLRIGGKLEG